MSQRIYPLNYLRRKNQCLYCPMWHSMDIDRTERNLLFHKVNTSILACWTCESRPLQLFVVFSWRTIKEVLRKWIHIKTTDRHYLSLHGLGRQIAIHWPSIISHTSASSVGLWPPSKYLIYGVYVTTKQLVTKYFNISVDNFQLNYNSQYPAINPHHLIS